MKLRSGNGKRGQTRLTSWKGKLGLRKLKARRTKRCSDTYNRSSATTSSHNSKKVFFTIQKEYNHHQTGHPWKRVICTVFSDISNPSYIQILRVIDKGKKDSSWRTEAK